MVSDIEALWIIFVIALANILTRFLPYFLLKGKIPPILHYISNILPSAIIAMLVVYCLKDTNIAAPFYGIKELLGILVVYILHISIKIPIISILGGVITYMLLVQMI